MNRRHFFIVTGMAAALARPAPAQGFPNRPMRIVVMFPAGGLADNIARTMAARMQETFGQPVVVENRPGGNGAIAAEAVARSAPDGHTLFLANDAALSINPLLHARLSYDAAADFAPVSLIATTVECVLVPASLPVHTVAEFVNYAKGRPGQLNYGSFGVGSVAHLTTEAFRRQTGIELVHIPYRGVAETVPALLNGQIQLLFTSQAQALPHIQAGTIRALAVLSERRQDTLPNVPTMAEAGFPDIESRGWFGFVVPAATPSAIIERLAAESRRIALLPEFQERIIRNLGLNSVASTPAEFAAVLADDRVRYRRKIELANVRLD
jgi:tripartite-type tricarboxylate transporter receptor subunit TctC